MAGPGVELTQAGTGGAHERRFQVSPWGNDSWQGSQAAEVSVECLGLGERILYLFVDAGTDSMGGEGRRSVVYVRTYPTLLYSCTPLL